MRKYQLYANFKKWIHKETVRLKANACYLTTESRVHGVSQIYILHEFLTYPYTKPIKPNTLNMHSLVYFYYASVNLRTRGRT